ncbi:MAG: hypothetical protein RLZZ326_612 [Planctomycetota bacterium]
MSRERNDSFGDETAELRFPVSGIVGAIAVAVLCGALGGAFSGFLKQDRWLQKPPVSLVASRGRVTLADERGEMPLFDRRESPEIWYRVLLDSAPLQHRLRLAGEWRDPVGRIAWRNSYETAPITHLPWETHVRFRLPADAMPGTWRVRLLADGGELYAMPFDVTDGADPKGGKP